MCYFLGFLSVTFKSAILEVFRKQADMPILILIVFIWIKWTCCSVGNFSGSVAVSLWCHQPSASQPFAFKALLWMTGSNVLHLIQHCNFEVFGVSCASECVISVDIFIKLELTSFKFPFFCTAHSCSAKWHALRYPHLERNLTGKKLAGLMIGRLHVPIAFCPSNCWMRAKVTPRVLLCFRERNSLLKEAEVLHKARFNHIIQIFGICNEPEFFCIVTEFMSNGSLDRLLHEVTVRRPGTLRQPRLILVLLWMFGPKQRNGSLSVFHRVC